MTHTPAPWRQRPEAHPYEIEGQADGLWLLRALAFGGTVEERDANAAFIVKAVNSYYPMLEALKHTQIVLHNVRVINLGELTQQQHLLLLEVNQVIKLAEGR